MTITKNIKFINGRIEISVAGVYGVPVRTSLVIRPLKIVIKASASVNDIFEK